MNLQDQIFSIQYQLANKRFPDAEATSIIKSFDLLSWFHRDCKIKVLHQNKIQKRITQSKEINFIFPQDLFTDQKNKQKLQPIIQKNLLRQSDYQKNKQYKLKYNNFVEINPKIQTENDLIKKTFQRQNSKLLFQKYSQQLGQTKTELLYRIFKIPQNNQNIQKTNGNTNFYLIQKSKLCFKNGSQITSSLINYILLAIKQNSSEQIFDFFVSINKNNQVLEIQIEKQNLEGYKSWINFTETYMKNNSASKQITSIDQYLRKSFKLDKKILKQTQIQYPYIQPESKRNKIIHQPHYALAFQGGGAKGLAYVGVYKALLQTKIQLKNIIGSSAGGIFALAVSTGITPQQLQKICYTMKKIPKEDRIVVSKAVRDEKLPGIIEAMKQLFSSYGILSQQLFEYIKGLLKDDVLAKLQQLINTASESIGQVFDRLDDGNINFYGLLIEGAAMKGQAIQKIASQCLTIFFLKKYKEEQDIFIKKAQNAFSLKKWALIKDQLEKNQKNYDILEELNISTILSIDDQVLNKDDQKDLIVSIITKSLLYLNQYEEQVIYQSNSNITVAESSQKVQIQSQRKFPPSQKIYQLDFSQVKKVIKLKENIPLGLQDEKIVYNILNRQINSTNLQSNQTLQDFQCRFGKPFILNSSWFQLIPSDKQLKTPKQQINIMKMLNCLSNKFQNRQKHWESLADIITQTIESFLNDKIDQKNKKIDQQKDQGKQVDLKLTIKKIQQLLNLRAIPEQANNKNKMTQTQRNIGIRQVMQKINSFKDFKNVMKIVTLQEYYALNQIQLTSTSVDLNDSTMRFFNHKTTPQLPVCKSVQMTGSFPVGFLAQHWKEQWGSYFVHYNGLRRQIDLIDHQFTDGGMLANFPIKYLQNELMRPKYFSHKKHKDNCTFAGFGLDQITTKQQDKSDQQKRLDNEAADKLSIAIGNFTQSFGINWKQYIKIGWKLFTSPLSDTKVIDKAFKIQTAKHIQDIPLLRFLFKFLMAYPNADRNLNLQCYQKRIIYQECQAIKDLHQSQEEISKQSTLTQVQRIQLMKLLKLKLDQLKAHKETQKPNTGFFSRFARDPKAPVNLSNQKQVNFYTAMYKAIFNYTEQNFEKLIQNFNKSNQPKNSKTLYQKINENEPDENLILHHQAIIRYEYKDLDDYFNISTNFKNNNDLLNEFMRKAKSHDVLNQEKQKKQQKKQSEQIIKKFEKSRLDNQSQLKVLIIQTFLQKMVFNKSNAQLNTLTIQFLMGQAKLDLKRYQNKKDMNRQQIEQLSTLMTLNWNQARTEQQKLLLLAQIHFIKLLYSFQLDKLQEFTGFQKTKSNYYEKLVKNKPENITQTRNETKTEIFKKLKGLKTEQLMEFISLQKQLITRDQKRFTVFLFSKINGIQLLLKQTPDEYRIFSMESKQILQKYQSVLSIQILLKLWNQNLAVEKNFLLDEQSIIKNYFQFELSGRLQNQIKVNPRKIVKILKAFLDYNNSIFGNAQALVLKDIFSCLNLDSSKQSEERNSLQLELVRYTIDYIMRNYKIDIFQKTNNTSIQSILVKKWNENNYENYFNQKYLQVFNIFEIARVSQLIKNIIIKKSPNQSQILQNIQKVLVQNSSLLFFQIYNSDLKINKRLDQFYSNSAKTIYSYLKKSNQNSSLQNEQNKINGQRQRQKAERIKQSNEIVFRSIVSFQQKNLIKDIESTQQFKTQLQKYKLKYSSVIKKHGNLVKLSCLEASFRRKRLQIFNNKLVNKITKIQIKTGNKNTSISLQDNFTKFKSDYFFFTSLLSQICLSESKRLIISDISQDIIKTFQSWVKQLNSLKLKLNTNPIESKQKFLQIKETIFKTCEKYNQLIQINQKFKNKYVFIAEFNEFMKYIKNWGKIFFIQQQIKILKEIQKIQQKVNEMSRKISIVFKQAKQYTEQIHQLSIIYQRELGKSIKNSKKLYNKMNDVILQKFKKLFVFQDQEVTKSSIEQVFMVSHSFSRRVANLEQNISNSNLIKMLRNYNFVILMTNIDKNLLQKKKNKNLQNKIYWILDNQIQKLQTLNPQDSKNPQFKKDKIVQNIYQYSKEYQTKIHNLHLILQGAGHSHLYYASYCDIIQQNIKKMNQQRKDDKIQIQIKAITCSNFHSVYGFLYATGMDVQQLMYQMKSIHSLSNVLQRKIQENYGNYKWTACSQMEIKSCFQEVWKDQYNIFDELQQSYPQDVNVNENIKAMRILYITDKQKIMSYCDSYLDDLIYITEQKISKQPQVDKQFITCKTLGVNYKEQILRKANFAEQNKQSSKIIIDFMQKIFSRFESLMQYLVSSNELTLKNMVVDQSNKKLIWKGIIIKKLFSTYKLKEYIQKRLKKLKMNPNITLEQFYNYQDKECLKQNTHLKNKILLTFTSINNSNQRLEFINKNTLPNMPLWAAILASASLPFIFREFQARKQWTSKGTTGSLYSSTVLEYFEKKETKALDTVKYSSGNIISTLPFQLLTNDTVLNEMFKLDPNSSDDVKFIFLGIAFKSEKNKPLVKDHKLERKYFSLGMVAWNSLFFFKLKDMAPIRKEYVVKKLKKLLGYSTTGSSLNLFTSSNDNLIMQLYKQKVVKCPIRIGTLDFHVITENRKQVKADFPSEKSLQTIERSYFITKSFIKKAQSNYKDEANRLFELYFRISLIHKKDNQSDNSYKLLFLSHSGWNKSPQKLLKIEYLIEDNNFQNKKFVQVQNQQISWKAGQGDSLTLKLSYLIGYKYHSKHVIESNKLKISLNNLLKEYSFQKNNYPVSFDYIIDYQLTSTAYGYKKQTNIAAINMNRVSLEFREENNKEDTKEQRIKEDLKKARMISVIKIKKQDANQLPV